MSRIVSGVPGYLVSRRGDRVDDGRPQRDVLATIEADGWVTPARLAAGAVTPAKLDIDFVTSWSEMPTGDDRFTGRVVYFKFDHGCGFDQITKLVWDGDYWIPVSPPSWVGAQVNDTSSIAHNTWTTIAGSDLDLPTSGVFLVGVDAALFRVTSSVGGSTRLRLGVNDSDNNDTELAVHWVTVQNDGGPAGGTPVVLTLSNSVSANLTMRYLQQFGTTESLQVQDGHLTAIPLRLDA